MRVLVSRMFQRTILAWRLWTTSPRSSAETVPASIWDGEVRLHLGIGGIDGSVALGLVGDLVGGAQVRLGDGEHVLFERRVVRSGEVARLLGGLLGELDDRVDDRLEAAWPNITAPSIVSSESSWASDSTISTAS
jgi:hypothetical protein